MADTRNQENPPEFDREKPRRMAAPESDDSKGGSGISNRPLDEEEQNQERLPPRGHDKSPEL
jgi:hypothetical protein